MALTETKTRKSVLLDYANDSVRIVTETVVLRDGQEILREEDHALYTPESKALLEQVTSGDTFTLLMGW